MTKAKTHEKENTNSKRLNKKPEANNKVQIIVLALLVAVGLNIVIWNQLIQPHNEKRFEETVTQAASAYQESIAGYIAQTQLALKDAGDQIASIKSLRQQTSWDFFETEGFDLTTTYRGDSAPLISMQLFPVEQLTPERIQQNQLNNQLTFIDIDRLNQVMRDTSIFPEAVKQKDNDTWVIHWVTPIFEDGSLNTLTAILLSKTTISPLTDRLSTISSYPLQVNISQDIGFSGSRTFLTIGEGSSRGQQSQAIIDSAWQVNVLPGDKLWSEIFTVPSWMIGLIIAVLILCFAPAIWLITRPPEEEGPTVQALYLQEKAKLDAEKANAAVTVKSNEEESPLEVIPENADTADTEMTTVIPTAEVVEETYAVPDAIFRAYDIRGLVGEELTLELAYLIGQSVASEALAANDNTIIVGHDARTHSPELAHYLQQGIISTGCNVVDIGLVPTPLLNYAVTTSDKTNSGIIVTASHNPKQDNGFKIIINEKNLLADDIQTLKQRIIHNHFSHAASPGVIEQHHFEENYIETVISDVAVGPEVKVVIDASNGATSQLAPALFDALGCEVVPLFCEFDGEFPNHDPDPCSENNLQPLIEKVIAENATLGIALDGDGDRLVIITPKGQIIWPDQLLMIFATDLVARNPGCDVVYDIKSTRHLSSVIADLGGRPIMWKTGHSNIKQKMRESGALLAGEFSGHIFFKERWFGFDDGMYAAARLLEILSLSDDTLDDMLEQMPTSVSTPEIKIAIDNDEKQTFIKRLIDESYFEDGEKTLIDGLRVDFAKGWGLVRASNTSSALTLRFEGDNEDSITSLKAIFKRELEKIDSQLSLDF